jgi:hypothetical protein
MPFIDVSRAIIRSDTLLFFYQSLTFIHLVHILVLDSRKGETKNERGQRNVSHSR